MKICRKCGAKYPDNEEICSVDGQKLHQLPNFLVGRPSTHSTRPRADPFVGKYIEKYKIIRQIGEGGMGVVYEAEHIHIGKKVALKILREDYTKKLDVVERFKQEARSASIIGHPNIIDVTDFGYTHDGRVFFVMEYLEGEDLATILETERTLPYKRAVRIARQVCDALCAAHDKGIVHRDMKPENIFIVHPNARDEKVKILDFGIAKMSVLDQEGRKLTKTGVVFGTPEYMSPEQAAGKPVDKKIDIYSLGIILYEMMTGKVPFTGDSFMSILSKHIFEPVPRLKQAAPDLNIPSSLEAIIYRCLEKVPERRIGSAEELASLLDAVENEEETTISVEIKLDPKLTAGATPSPVLEVIGEGELPVEKKKSSAVFLAVILILVPLLAGGGFLYYKLSKARDTEGGTVNPGLSLHDKNDVKDLPVGKTLGDLALSKGSQAPDAAVSGEPPIPAAPEEVLLSIDTIPAGAVVDVEGKGNKCPATPCHFMAVKGEEIVLIVKRGKISLRHPVTPLDDPTEVKLRIGKPEKKAGEKGSEKGKEKTGKGSKKIKNIDSGDLKTPDIFRDKDG
jgi:serine/threonine protein kinase